MLVIPIGEMNEIHRGGFHDWPALALLGSATRDGVPRETDLIIATLRVRCADCRARASSRP